MTDTKPAISSLTIQGVLVALVPSVLKLFGIDLGEDAGPAIGVLIEAGLEFGGAALAIYGRLRATKRIG